MSLRGTPNLQSLQLWHANIWQLYPAIMNQAALPYKPRTSVGIALPRLDSPCFRIMPKRSIPIVTTLILDMKFSDGEELRKAAYMLSLFPSLQTLRIWCYNFLRSNKDNNVPGQWQLPAADTVVCLSNKSLKNVTLQEYCGTEAEVEFARFIVAGAKALTTMHIFHHAAANWSDDDINNHKDLICRGGKASTKARVNFHKSKNSEKSLRKAYSSVHRVPIV
uniref:Uncharacterized protein n=1 Tax=Avena sativa TaxID=4498 RepID=A0ACD5U841_AVESA